MSSANMSDTTSTNTLASATEIQTVVISDTDCSICFETITSTSGHATLGCAHRFHLMCVVRWFQEQEGPSSCPCCRHEVGTLDNIPIYPEDEEADDDDNGSGTLSGWTTDDDDEEEDDDEEDTDSIGSLRRVWTRDSIGGQWEGRWILHRPTVTVWDPTAPATEEAGGDPPEELTDVATEIQRIWRGYSVRRALRSPDTITVEELPSIPSPTLAITVLPLHLPSDWLMDRMMRVD